MFSGDAFAPSVCKGRSDGSELDDEGAKYGAGAECDWHRSGMHRKS